MTQNNRKRRIYHCLPTSNGTTNNVTGCKISCYTLANMCHRSLNRAKK